MTDNLNTLAGEELKPCPFCGGCPTISRAHQNVMLAMGEAATDDHFLWTLHHTCPSGMSITLAFWPRTKAIAAWNTRAHPQPTGDVGALVEAMNLGGCSGAELGERLGVWSKEAMRVAEAMKNAGNHVAAGGYEKLSEDLAKAAARYIQDQYPHDKRVLVPAIRAMKGPTDER